MLTMINSTLPQYLTLVFPSTEATAKAEVAETHRRTRRSASRLLTFRVHLGTPPNGPVYIGDTAGAMGGA
jgi:hypothetical protein